MCPQVAISAAVLALLFSSTAAAQTEAILIRASKPYAQVVRAVERSGGRVIFEFQNFDGLAAELPSGALSTVTALTGPGSIFKDLEVKEPAPIEPLQSRFSGLARTGDEERLYPLMVRPLASAEVARIGGMAYSLNNALMNATALHSAGITGEGVVVAVIDIGFRPGFAHIEGSIVGCETFVPASDTRGCINDVLSGHGTFVAGMIAAHALFEFAAGSAFREAVLAECPECFANPPTYTQIPMIGSAPSAKIYALRVGGAASRFLAAVDRVITLRKQFDAGTGGADIEVCNISLGILTQPAVNFFQAAIDALLQADIVPVISAGNSGPSTITIGDPGSTGGAVTVGAASLPVNRRISNRLMFGPSFGPLVNPSPGAQTAFFSSRGPTPDGRLDPDVIASGDSSFGQGFGAPASISIASGTSFSGPTVAGIAALLRQALPTATARQVRNAIVAAANPGFLADRSGELDQGTGFVDAAAALAVLRSGNASDVIAPMPRADKSLKVNVEGAGLDVRDGFVRERFADLRPGQRVEIAYRVRPNTKQVVVTVHNVTPALPPGQQNQLFGDDAVLAVHNAKTGDHESFSAVPTAYVMFEFTTGGTFILHDPEPGIARITVLGDWTNAGSISTDVEVFAVTDPLPQFTRQGTIVQSQSITVPIEIPAGTSEAEFRLAFREDWSRYLLNDIDVILIRPDGSISFAAALLNAPEVAVERNPMPGSWRAVVLGSRVNTIDDKWELRVSLDGTVVK
jgi:serine protease AprX